MSSSLENVARIAIQELLDVSPQVEVALVTTRTGDTVAASLRSGVSADHIASRITPLIVRMIEQTERARVELGREPVTQCEVACGDGSVFLVADASRVVVAVTDAEPTVGLVFYDLKTALRVVREADAASTNGLVEATSDVATSTPSDNEGAQA